MIQTKSPKLPLEIIIYLAKFCPDFNTYIALCQLQRFMLKELNTPRNISKWYIERKQQHRRCLLELFGLLSELPQIIHHDTENQDEQKVLVEQSIDSTEHGKSQNPKTIEEMNYPFSHPHFNQKKNSKNSQYNLLKALNRSLEYVLDRYFDDSIESGKWIELTFMRNILVREDRPIQVHLLETLTRFSDKRILKSRELFKGDGKNNPENFKRWPWTENLAKDGLTSCIINHDLNGIRYFIDKWTFNEESTVDLVRVSAFMSHSYKDPYRCHHGDSVFSNHENFHSVMDWILNKNHLPKRRLIGQLMFHSIPSRCLQCCRIIVDRIASERLTELEWRQLYESSLQSQSMDIVQFFSPEGIPSLLRMTHQETNRRNETTSPSPTPQLLLQNDPNLNQLEFRPRFSWRQWFSTKRLFISHILLCKNQIDYQKRQWIFFNLICWSFFVSIVNTQLPTNERLRQVSIGSSFFTVLFSILHFQGGCLCHLSWRRKCCKN